MAQSSTISAAQPGLAILGRQYRARALCCRPCAADNAHLRPVDRRVLYAAAVRAASSGKGLAGATRSPSAGVRPLGDRFRPQQRDVLLGIATYRSIECAADPVVGPVVRGAVGTD